MKNTMYRGFRIQDNDGKISIFPQNATARSAFIGGYGLVNGGRGLTFKQGPKGVKSTNGAKEVIRELYKRNDAFMEQQDALTRRALRDTGIGTKRKPRSRRMGKSRRGM